MLPIFKFRPATPLARGFGRPRSITVQCASVGALIAAWGTNFAHAQEEATTDEVKTYETVTVTARFREESAQDIGGSISALDGGMLEREGVSDFGDLVGRIAGLDATDRGPNQNDVAIRGISNGLGAGFADTGLSGPLVSQFVDDIPVSQSTASQRDFNYFDFDRVEVLRGPQPTLFGEGSVGGTIRYATRDPDLSGEPTSDSVLKAGVSFTEDGGTNYSLSAASSLILVPDKLGVRGVINYRDDAGFIDNAALGTSNINDFDSVSGRIVALYKPNADLSIRLMAFVGDDDIGENYAVAPPPIAPGSLISNSPIDGESEDDFELYTGKIEYDFGPIEVSSITGIFKRDSRTEFLCGTCAAFGLFLPVSLAPQSTLTNQDTSFTQEVRIVSDIDGPISFIGGAFYQDTEFTSQIRTEAAGFGSFVVLPAGSDILFEQKSDIQSEQISGFIELTFAATDKLRLIGGLRYVDEEITNTTILSTLALGGGPFGLEPPFVLANLTDFVVGAGLSNTGVFSLEKFLPRAALEYDMADNAMIYAVAASGIRNGNLNPSSSAFFASGGDPNVFSDIRRFSEDEALSYEVGVKSTWAGGAITANAAAFNTEFKNPQVEFAAPFVTVDNAPDLQISGVELETAWRINEYLDVYFNGTVQDTEFQGNQLLSPSTLLAGFDFDLRKGNKAANSPEVSYSIGANSAYPVFEGDLTLIGHIGYNYTGSRYSNVINYPSSELQPLGILNMRLGVEADSWSVTAFASNLTNEIEFTSIAGSIGTPVVTASGMLDFVPSDVAINRPRTVGIEAVLKF
jgi:outer membrane receptor protein involved in Fe transport